jgi:hypothetical protein
MTRPSDPSYWEDWARGLGWDSQRVAEAGRVGSLAIRRRMTPVQAMDVVLARVRDGRDVRIGISPADRAFRDSLESGVIYGFFVAAIGAFRLLSPAPFVWFPIATALLAVAALGFALKAASRSNWKLPALTVGLSVAGIALLLIPTSH